MMLFDYSGEVHRVVGTAGDELSDCIRKCIKYCADKDCKVLLNFNGYERLITIGSSDKILSDNWYNDSFDFIASQRDKKLTDLGI